MLVAGNEKLRFEAVMLSSNDADENRKFIISIRLSDDMIGNGSETKKKEVKICYFRTRIRVRKTVEKRFKKSNQEILASQRADF